MNQFAKSLLFVGILMIAASPAFAVLTVTHLVDTDLAGTFASRQHVGEGRAGDGALTVEYEVGIGGTMGAPTATGHYAWLDNVKAAFLLDYNATTNIVSFSIGGVLVQETIVLSGTTEILLRVEGTRNNLTMAIENIVVDGEILGEEALSTSFQHDILWISGAVIADGFVITGDVKPNWGGATPVGDEFTFSAELANTSAVPTEETTWGAIKALYN